VHLLGYRAYETLPGYLKAFDAVVIPYRRCAATRGVFPIKFFESLASGRPVVISDLPSLSEYFQAVRVARDAEEFVTACDAAIAESQDGAARERRMALARANTWESRISKLLDRIDGARTHGVGVTGKGTGPL
jgi:glycosyltransferase involved in cell wall biosynthesis